MRMRPINRSLASSRLSDLPRAGKMLGVEMKSETDPSASPERILIVFDGHGWWIRHIYLIEHKLDFNRMVYHSDRNLGGPFGSMEEAVAAAKEMLYDPRHKRSTRIA